MPLNADRDRRWVTVTVPMWLYGGNPKGFFSAAGLRTRPAPDRATWRIKTTEAYTRRRPDLISANVLIGAHKHSADRSTLPQDAPEWTPLDRAQLPNLPPQPAELELLDLLNYGRINVVTAPREELPDACLRLLDEIRALQFLEDGLQTFPEADVHIIGISQRLRHRLKMPQVFLQLSIEPNLDVAEINRRAGSRELIFKSSEGLLTGAYFLDPYFGPLLGALSPAIWGVAVPRGGQLIFNLGRQVGGTTVLAPDLLSTITKQGADSPVTFAQLPPGSVPAALNWWANQLNDMFGVLSDPAIFATADERYLPARHMEVLLTFEQLFRRATSIRTNHQDLHAARTLMFSTIDTFEGLLGIDILRQCHPGHAKKVLSRLRETIPIAAQPVLLPAAERAVDALSATAAGFFLTDHDDRIGRGGPGQESLTREDGTAHLLKLMRNATHGHGPTKGGEKAVALSNQLLGRHDGHLPSDLALLGHLYLLDLLSDPSRLRRILNLRSS
jgi:hypothetical protein